MNSYAKLNRCLIADNGSQAEGGAMWIYYTELPVTNCTITNNSTIYGLGEAIYVTQASVTIVNSIIWNDSGSAGEVYLDVEATAEIHLKIAGKINWLISEVFIRLNVLNILQEFNDIKEGS